MVPSGYTGLSARETGFLFYRGIIMSDERLQSKEEIFARGKLFEVVQLPQENGAVLEVDRRAAGVRIIIPNKEDGKILLTREFRRELNNWDWRLPGGKVFDSLEEFD